MMWISNKMSLDGKPWKEGEIKENAEKNPALHVTLLDTLWKSSLLSTQTFWHAIVLHCVFSVWGASPSKKLKWWESWHVMLNNITCFSIGEEKKGRSTMLSSKKITTEEMSAATSSDPVPGK